jgi:pyruvate/2-oxoglutarate dehydrogenase complex dihydrolipoamide dehydrogenase (E3) component
MAAWYEQHDWIIFGGTAAGRLAAQRAARLGQRVALVEPAIGERRHWAELWVQQSRAIATGAIDWQSLNRQAQWQARQAASEAASLAALGVDYLVGDPVIEQSRRGEALVRVGDRWLRGRRWLVAVPGRSTVPAWTADCSARAYSPESIADIADRGVRPGERWLVMADSPLAIELAGALQQLGAQVTVAAASDRLLQGLPTVAADWLQAELAARSIETILRATPQQSKVLDGQTWVQIGDRALEIDCLLSDRYDLPLLPKGLAIGLPDLWERGTTDRLQLLASPALGRSAPPIYGCGAILGGYPLPDLAAAEALWVIEEGCRAAWQPSRPMRYDCQPWGVGGDWSLALVGQFQFHDSLNDHWHDPCHASLANPGDRPSSTVTANAVTLNQAIGRCHLQFDDRQRLRSAVLLAPDARSALVPVSLLLARSGSLADLAQLPAARSSAIELLRQTAIAATTLEPKA